MKTRGVKEIVNRLGVLKHITLFKRLRIARLIKAKRVLLLVPIVSLLTAGCMMGGGSQSAAAPAVAAPTVSVNFVPAPVTPPPAGKNPNETKCTDSGGTWTSNACVCSTEEKLTDGACVAAAGVKSYDRMVVEVMPDGMSVFDAFTADEHETAEEQLADICKKVLFTPGSTPELPAMIRGKDGISLYEGTLSANALVVAFMECSDASTCILKSGTVKGKDEDYVSSGFLKNCNDAKKNRYFICYNSNKLSEDTELNKLVTEAVPDTCEEEEAADDGKGKGAGAATGGNVCESVDERCVEYVSSLVDKGDINSLKTVFTRFSVANKELLLTTASRQADYVIWRAVANFNSRSDGNIEVVNYLLSQGSPSVLSRNLGGHRNKALTTTQPTDLSVLMIAARGGQVGVVDALLVAAKGLDKDKALLKSMLTDELLGWGGYVGSGTPLMVAAQCCVDVVQKLLDAAIALGDDNVTLTKMLTQVATSGQWKGFNALAVAVQAGREDVVRVLGEATNVSGRPGDDTLGRQLSPIVALDRQGTVPIAQSMKDQNCPTLTARLMSMLVRGRDKGLTGNFYHHDVLGMLKGSAEGTAAGVAAVEGVCSARGAATNRFFELTDEDVRSTTPTTGSGPSPGESVAVDAGAVSQAVDLCLSSIVGGSKSKRGDLEKMGLEKMRVELHDAIRSNSQVGVKELFCVLGTDDKNKLLRDDFGGDLTMPPTVAAVLGRDGVASMGAWDVLMNEATCDDTNAAEGCVSRLELLTAKVTVKGTGGRLGEFIVPGQVQGWNAFLLAARGRPINTVRAILAYIRTPEEEMKGILGSVTGDGCNALVAVGRSKRGVEARRKIASVIARGFGKDQCEGASGKYKSLCADTRLKLLTATCTPAGGSRRKDAVKLFGAMPVGKKVNACQYDPAGVGDMYRQVKVLTLMGKTEEFKALADELKAKWCPKADS